MRADRRLGAVENRADYACDCALIIELCTGRSCLQRRRNCCATFFDWPGSAWAFQKS